ncbi:hypothetical protein I4U23_023032 [Adineta vaga]|nr:hypothetical protein I4U23_023032 [Adineta vaga]
MGCGSSKSTSQKVVSPRKTSHHSVHTESPAFINNEQSAIHNTTNKVTNRSTAEDNQSDTSDALLAAGTNHVEIIDADLEAYNNLFLKQRQDAMDNSTYRKTIEAWHPNSLQQLVEFIRVLSKDKLLVDRHWMIFYWIACNIEYDAVSFLNHNIPEQSAESVFRTKKGVCAGYSHLYKSLCDQLAIKCEELSGYAKGYGFATREETAALKTDHAWNVIEINQHWYLLDVTWGTGHLNQQNIFNRKLNCFYFLTRPNQMIYDHLPENDKWQLLRQPIQMTQYFQMPRTHSAFFEFNLEIISPRHQAHVTLVRDKSYALILIRAPADVDLTATFELNGNEVDGGGRIVFDEIEQLHRCYFAPANIGNHTITFFANINERDMKSAEAVVEFTLNIVELPLNRVSYPITMKEFYNLNLKVISPVNTHLVKVCNGDTQACIVLRAPTDVKLTSSFTNSDGKNVEGGKQVYYDQQNDLWQCKFAPDRDGIFKANIFGKKKAADGSSSHVISFKIEASQIPTTPLSFPSTWQLFHDLNLEIETPKNCASITWPKDASYVECLIRAPDEQVQLSCALHYNDTNVENASLVQFDNDRKIWQLLFAPQRIGRIYEPINGILKKGTTIPIHCMIPDVTDVNLTIDSKWAKVEGYQNPDFKRTVTVGSKEITIYAKYEEDSNYQALVKYSVK